MKILHLVHNYAPEFRGGTERYLEALVAEQVKSHEVTVLCGSEVRKLSLEVVVESEARPRVLRFHRAEADAYTVVYHPAGMKALLGEVVRSTRPDVAHVHHWFNLGNNLIALLNALDVPAIVTLHDAYAACARFFMVRPDGFFCGDAMPVPLSRCRDCVAADYDPPALMDELRERRATMKTELEGAARVLVPSAAHGKLLARSGLIPKVRLNPLPLGLLSPIEPVPPKRAPGTLRVGTWGHLSPVKGIRDLVAAVRELHARHAGKLEAHLFGAPTPDFKDEIGRLAAGLPITMHGAFAPADIARFPELIDLAVFPSHAHESYSLVLDEAIMLRIPFVVSDRGAFAERATRGGDIVPLRRGEDYEEFARDLARTIERYLLEPGLLEVKHAMLKDNPWTIADHAHALDAIYREAVDKAAHAGE
ncbi:MAG: glycosyltransferase [Planctomycetota bacterium]